MDPDFQLNGIVGYYFDGLTRTRGPFQIDRDTGEIRLRPDMDGALDREIVDFYEVRCLLDGRHAIYNYSLLSVRSFMSSNMRVVELSLIYVH